MPRKRSSLHPLLAAAIETIPPLPLPEGKSFGSAEREDFVTLFLHACNLVYGRAETKEFFGGPAGGGMTDLALSPTFSRTGGQRLYVIKENGNATCDGAPMALKDLPEICTFHDKRGEFADPNYAWESIMWADVGAAPQGTPKPPGMTIVPKAAGAKLRAVRGDEAGIMT